MSSTRVQYFGQPLTTYQSSLSHDWHSKHYVLTCALPVLAIFTSTDRPIIKHQLLISARLILIGLFNSFSLPLSNQSELFASPQFHFHSSAITGPSQFILRRNPASKSSKHALLSANLTVASSPVPTHRFEQFFKGDVCRSCVLLKEWEKVPRDSKSVSAKDEFNQ